MGDIEAGLPLRMNISEPDPGTSLGELGIDSLTLTECMFKIEDRFGITVSNSDTNVKTLKDIADMVDRLVAEKHVEASPA